MDLKRLILTALTLFVVVFVFEWVFHGGLMASVYEQTAELWRSEQEMTDRFVWMIVGQLMLASAVALLFAWGCKAGGVREGLTLGAILALLRMAGNTVMYVVAPYPVRLIAWWDAGATIEMLLLGLVAGLIYAPRR